MAMVVIAASCNVAWADGDPASDVLLSQRSFLPADAGFSSAGQARLEGLLSSAARAGYPVRVAIIPNSYDLGSITVLWRKPETYARFLGAELSLVYKHPLIVVMPNGLGLNWPGHSIADAQRQLTGLTVSPGPTGLLDGAVTAVRRLLSSSHVHLAQAGQTAAIPGASPPPRKTAKHGRSGAGDARWIIIALAFAALLAGAALVRWRPWHGWRGRRRPGRGAAPSAAGAAATGWLRWSALAAVGLVLAIGVPIATVWLVRGGSAGARPAQSSPGTLFMLPEGRQRAPLFTLRDQRGHPLSLGSFGGRDVLITFVDPLCRNLCPLEAHVLNTLVASLPAARRPAIIAVSVDPWADSRHNLTEDFSKWSLVPQWHWAVGGHAQLASVWKRYAVAVQVVTKHLAGTTVHYITHDEVAYLVDPAGFERAMFAWPFSPQDVLATLRRISRAA
jgi:cytochrome oxidase Cu insertion factor (SCO1/SenC/PrrC family)